MISCRLLSKLRYEREQTAWTCVGLKDWSEVQCKGSLLRATLLSVAHTNMFTETVIGRALGK